MQCEPQKVPVAPGTAAITTFAPAHAGLTMAASASHVPGIGRVDFVLIDLTGDQLADVVDRKDVDYAKPPMQVAEAWQSSVALIPERPYRVFFHVYDRTGVNLVAFDRRDFACEA